MSQINQKELPGGKHAVQAIAGTPEDALIRRFWVSRAAIQAEPVMNFPAAGFPVGESTLDVSAHLWALSVMAARQPEHTTVTQRVWRRQFKDRQWR